MVTEVIRIDREAALKLRALSTRLNTPQQEVLAAAIETYRRQCLLNATNAAFAALRNDPQAWKEELGERADWELATADGTQEGEPSSMYVANCDPSHWEACRRERVFGVKPSAHRLPQAGDLVLVRITGPGSYGVKAVWRVLRITDDDGKSRWPDGPYAKLVWCESLSELPELFGEDFEGKSKLSGVMRAHGLRFSAARIMGSLRQLSEPESVVYATEIMRRFSGSLEPRAADALKSLAGDATHGRDDA